ncbi:MAG: DUF1836 domain-containing protein [Clostridia bacterium]|nr:DUF1836 domain-containing protein [Clostridia bacterium]
MAEGMERVYSEISRFTPIPWDTIPDLGLYMDQVITFITRAYEPLYGESTKGYLSAPMINNYVKNKLIPRPSGKKYSRLQIAMLIMIVVLKRVSTMEDIREMLCVEGEEDVRRLYELFCARQAASIQAMLSMRSELNPAMDCAIFASAYRAGCECMLQPHHKDPEEEK